MLSSPTTSLTTIHHSKSGCAADIRNGDELGVKFVQNLNGILGEGLKGILESDDIHKFRRNYTKFTAVCDILGIKF